MQLSARDLAAVRGGRPVFAGVSLGVAAGDVLAVTGANGAGKSTLLRLIAGLLRPSAGTVSLSPQPEGGMAVAAHYLGHLDALKSALTVRQNLDYWRRLWNGGPVETALEAVGLGHLAELHVDALSAGQRRRVAIARLLIAERPLWLLDEPATALDAAAEATLGRLIEDHCGRGGMAIVATHRDLPVPASATLRLGG